MGGDDLAYPIILDEDGVSIHAPAWGATAAAASKKLATEVSIHAPAWGATPHQLSRRSRQMFQSTPPHGGRLSIRNMLSGLS